MKIFKDLVVVKEILAHINIDIVGVLIGMHIKCVAIPLKLENKKPERSILLLHSPRDQN